MSSAVMSKDCFVSVVLPLHNEAQSAATVIDELGSVLTQEGVQHEILAIDDGSSDDTNAVLERLASDNEKVSVIAFTRNFGKEAAILAGLRHAGGDAVVVMDGDGQHPPNLLPQLLEAWLAGSPVVVAQKERRESQGFASSFFVSSFYVIFRLLTKMDIERFSDYMMLDRMVVDRYCNLPERQRFFRGLIAWMNYPCAYVPFQVPERVLGSSSWSKTSLLVLAARAITSFTSKPLHSITVIAFVYALMAIVLGGLAVVQSLTGAAERGFPTVIILILVTGSFLMFGLGQLGAYIEGIFNELKARPDYLIDPQKSSIQSE